MPNRIVANPPTTVRADKSERVQACDNAQDSLQAQEKFSDREVTGETNRFVIP